MLHADAPLYENHRVGWDSGLQHVGDGGEAYRTSHAIVLVASLRADATCSHY